MRKNKNLCMRYKAKLPERYSQSEGTRTPHTKRIETYVSHVTCISQLWK